MTFNAGAIFEVTVHGIMPHGGAASVAYQMELLPPATDVPFEDVVADMVEMMDATMSEYALLQVDTFQWIGVSVQTLNGADVSGYIPFAAAIDGLVAENTVPSSVCVVVNYPTGIANHQLRKFIPAAGVGDIAPGGRLLAASLLSWAAVGADVLIPYEATNGLWQYCHVANLGEEDQFVVYPNACSIKQEFGIQGRRRL